MVKTNPARYAVLCVLFVFSAAGNPAEKSNIRHYLLITNNDLANAFQPLVDRRISQGFTGELITVESINSTYSGIDIQEKIRNCIKDYYDPNVSLFVALGGDAIEGDVENSIVPVRYCPKQDKLVPTDMYYADMDGGNWDSDYNGIYGEDWDVTAIELAPEVYVGRIPVRTSEEAEGYIDKVIRYETASPEGFANSMIIFAGATKDSKDLTGDKRPEGYCDHDPVSSSEIKRTDVYLDEVQPSWQAVPLHLFFDTKSPWDEFACGDYDLTCEHLRERLSVANEGKGYHMIYHTGHSNAHTWGLGRESRILEGRGFWAEDIYALTNSIPCVLFTSSCGSAYFDNRNQEPCIGEAFIRNPNGGAVVYFGASRSSGHNETRLETFKEVFKEKSVYFGEAIAHARARVAAASNDESKLRLEYKYTFLGDPAIKRLDIERGRKVQVFQPKGCEVIATGDDMTIRWNAAGTGFGPSELVRLDYSNDSGQSWHPVPEAEQLPYDGCSFVWQNCPLPPGTQYRIRVTCLSDPSATHYSDRDFTIAEMGLLTVISYPFDELKIDGTQSNITNYTHSVKIGDTVSLTAPQSVDKLQFAGWCDPKGNTLSNNQTYDFTFLEDATIIAQYGYLGPIKHFYVNDEISEDDVSAGSDLNDGLTPQTPKRLIQSLINSNPQIGWGAVIHISEGNYPDNIALNELNSGLTLIGAGPHLTVIDGQTRGSCLRLENCIYCTVADLTLTGGNADYGGGIWSSNSSLVVDNCIVNENIAAESGGGLYCNQGDTWISNCLFELNEAGVRGGGVFIDGSVTITGCTITANAAWRGAGICCRHTGPVTMSHCVLSRNLATDKGGGMLTYVGASPTITNCVFYANRASTGGGIRCERGNPILTNCIFWGDHPDEIREGNGTPLITYSNVQGGWSGDGNIHVDPLFVDSENGNFHLKSEEGHWDPTDELWVIDNVTSPCIDAGDPNSPVGDEPEPNGDRINMGAYGGTVEASMSLSIPN